MVKILKGLKALSALGLIICLFLPLSQCTSSSNAKMKKDSVVYERYVVMHKGKDKGLQGYVPVVFFALPILIVLLNIKVERELLRYELLEFMAGLLAFSVVIIHMKTGKLLFGGYMALSSSSVYIFATVTILHSRKNYKQQ